MKDFLNQDVLNKIKFTKIKRIAFEIVYIF